MSDKIQNSKGPGRPPDGTPDWAESFIAEITKGMRVQDAAAIAGVHGTMPYKRYVTDKEFADAWDTAAHLSTRSLEQEAGRRAYHGTVKPSRYGDVREYSDTLLMFLLRARRPKKYRENVEHKHSGVVGNVVLHVAPTIRQVEQVEQEPITPEPVVVEHLNGKHRPKVD